MNASTTPGMISSQDDIAREVASAIADDTTNTRQQDSSTSGSTHGLNFVSSESGSFVRISTPCEHTITSPVQASVPSVSSVALNFGEESSCRPDGGEGVTSGNEGNRGVWGWISNAVGGDIVETTQRLGRNLVQKTKVVGKTRDKAACI